VETGDEFCLFPPLLANQEQWHQKMSFLMQKERDWISIHPNAPAYAHTTPQMYDKRSAEEFFSQNPHARLGP
jgi:hypothetical protein